MNKNETGTKMLYVNISNSTHHISLMLDENSLSKRKTECCKKIEGDF